MHTLINTLSYLNSARVVVKRVKLRIMYWLKLVVFLCIIIIIQILRAISGGTWRIEEIILALVIFNLTITFSVGGYLIHLNNKISNVNTKIEGHFGWHKGKDTLK